MNDPAPIRTDTITVPDNYCGPSNVGNGGYMSALLARYIEGTAQINLRAPAPLDKPLTVEVFPENRARLRDGETLIAEGMAGEVNLTPPPAPDWEAAHAASLRSPMRTNHPYANCFGCGPERGPTEGLHIFSDQDNGQLTNIGTWEPHAGLAPTGQPVPDEMIWIALDCGNGSLPAIPAWERWGKNTLVVTGMISASIEGRVIVGERYTTRSWLVETDGRKTHMGTAVYDAQGGPVARARSLWMALVPRE